MHVLFSCKQAGKGEDYVSLTLIPPTTITTQVPLDIRAGIKNSGPMSKRLKVTFYLNEETQKNRLYTTELDLFAGSSQTVKFLMPTEGKAGFNTILLVVEGENYSGRREKKIEIVASETRSTRTIDGAWIGFYHWSEQEGKMWNPAIKSMTGEQWQELVSSMHGIKMNIVVLQESFRNQEHVGKHNIEKDGYKGRAFYPSKLYPGRMPITTRDPIEEILSKADKRDMNVFMGVGMYAWFDYTKGSLEWHKKVAKELWDMYGHHKSFYGWYVSEEGMGSLDCFETDSLKRLERRKEVINFFREFKPFCNELAPGKPVMFAPNGWGVGRAKNIYPELLKNVDIICPFAFARMPEGDLTGKQAVDFLQKSCDDAQAHLWLDLEAFLFNEKEGYLFPRPIREIKQDLTQFDNFEKIICYQYPGVFNDPKMSIRIGEESTIKLFQDYEKYLKEVNLKLY
jgi:hypothetical protein